jgi:hypothetical protein
MPIFVALPEGFFDDVQQYFFVFANTFFIKKHSTIILGEKRSCSERSID